MIVLCDAPTQKAQGGFDDFMKEFKDFNARGQIRVLAKGSLEECYPNHLDWNRTEQQVANMTGKQKTQLSKRVGDEITKGQFETDMKSVFETLVCAWELSF